jgi:acyl carrier protein
MKTKIIEIIIKAINDINIELNSDKLKNSDQSTTLYGSEGNLDSISLVMLISDVEEKVSNTFNKNIVLADERAMSQKYSPFKSVESLADYITELLNE